MNQQSRMATAPSMITVPQMPVSWPAVPSSPSEIQYQKIKKEVRRKNAEHDMASDSDKPAKKKKEGGVPSLEARVPTPRDIQQAPSMKSLTARVSRRHHRKIARRQ